MATKTVPGWSCGHPKCRQELRCVECVPDYAKNEHIFSGYRFNMSYWQATRSLFQLHNETINVWTHLIGIVIFVYLLFFVVTEVRTVHDRIYVLQQHFDGIYNDQLAPVFFSSSGSDALLPLADFAALRRSLADFHAEWSTLRREYLAGQQQATCVEIQKLDDTLQQIAGRIDSAPAGHHVTLHALVLTGFNLVRSELATLVQQLQSQSDAHYVPLWPLIVYIASALSCLGFSALFHLYSAVGAEPTHLLWRKLDYAGISVLISGSYVPCMYYLYELGSWRFVYLLCSFLIAAAVIGFTLTDKAYQPEYRTFRACLYVAFGLFGLVPGCHVAYVVSGGHPFILDVFLRLCLMGALYIFGAFLYVKRIPEVWWKGRLDIFLNSHQLFHVLVVVAAIVHYNTTLDLWKLAHMHFFTSN